MKRTTHYLYEYRDNRPIRNIGFVRVEEYENVTVLYVYGKGIPYKDGVELEFFLFKRTKNGYAHRLAGSVKGGKAMFGYRLEYSEKEGYQGLLILGRSEGKEIWSGASWSGRITNMEEIMKEEKEEAEEGTEKENKTDPRKKVYKIKRKDLVNLPKTEWRIANNNFLLHGYFNYHHLVSFQKDEEYWLGVPGIYHEKEEQAARSFGFEQFYKYEELDLELGEEEQDTQELFGYWCKTVGALIDTRSEEDETDTDGR